MQRNDFIDRLSALLTARPDLSPSRLAIDAGLDNSAIRALLKGKARHPRLDTALAICEALGTTLEAFMSAERAELEAGRIPRAPAHRSRDPIDRRILDLLSTLSPDERLRLLGYAEALGAPHAPSQPPEATHAPRERAPRASAGERQAHKIPD